MEHIDTVVLGSGIAGLGAARAARRQGRRAVIFEARHRTGGLLDNFEVDGFRFDHAVHLSFATEPLVREIFDRTPYLTHPADSICFEDGHWLKHPVQNNLHPLPPEQKVALIQSFLARPTDLADDDYEGWLRHQYGDAIAERYPIKYTRKYWGTPATELSTTWIGNRMRRAELSEILFGAFTDETPNTYYTKEMRYPEKGGYKAFIQGLIDESEIRTGRAAVRVDPAERAVYFADGAAVTYERLVSTLPLPVLAKMMDSPPPVMAAANRLVATSIDLVSVGVNSPVDFPLWLYVYDEDILASRVYSPSRKSPDNVPPGCSSLQFEIYSRGTESRFTTAQVLEDTRYALGKLGLCDPALVRFYDHRRLPYGNVIFYRGMEDDRTIVMNHATQRGVTSCGRFGEWDYLWSNQSFVSGYQALFNNR
jgi:protoporphyrinogen oxidase